MKKFFYFVCAVVLCCGFVACDTEENYGGSGSNYSKTDLIGNWQNVAYEDSVTMGEEISFKNISAVVYEAYRYLGDDEQEVIAKGTYTLNGDVIGISYYDVSVCAGDSNKLGDFINRKGRKVNYTIMSIEGTRMTVTDDSGKQIEFEMY